MGHVEDDGDALFGEVPDVVLEFGFGVVAHEEVDTDGGWAVGCDFGEGLLEKLDGGLDFVDPMIDVEGGNLEVGSDLQWGGEGGDGVGLGPRGGVRRRGL